MIPKNPYIDNWYKAIYEILTEYQINTPKVALNMHKFLRAIFLFIHGINVGFQLWQVRGRLAFKAVPNPPLEVALWAGTPMKPRSDPLRGG
jgi:hypothetical protein